MRETLEVSTPSMSLYELTNMVRSVLEQTMDGEYWMEAELAEARLASNGHFYVEFVQRDHAGKNLVARARGTMWARTYNMLAPLFERATGERLRAGLQVRVLVGVVFHELYGFSLNILNIDPDFTMGDMARRRREILAQLEADGILEDNRLLPLPRLLKRVAIVSSPTAAGYEDFCKQLMGNAEGLAFEMHLFPAIMQGAQVEESILAALAAICDEAEAFDCVVIIRGGGATSDLSDFDSYNLAAAVTQMPLPVIVGIGHERDETVLDVVAHTSVKTPTAAAAFLIEHQSAQLQTVNDLSRLLTQQAALRLKAAQEHLVRMTMQLPQLASLISERHHHRLTHLSMRLPAIPRQLIMAQTHRGEACWQRIAQSARFRLQAAKNNVQNFENRLQTLSPELQLKRGFSLTYTSDGRLVKKAEQLPPGSMLITQLAQGRVTSQVTDSDPR